MNHHQDPIWAHSYDDGVSWDQEFSVYPVSEMLTKTAEKFGDRPAINCLGHKMTWAQIEQKASLLARGLQAMGIGAGDHVGLFLPNCSYYLIAYFGVLKTGATLVNFNPLYAPAELVHQINDSQTKLMITLDLKQLYDVLAPLVSSTMLEHILVCPFLDILPFPKSLLFQMIKGRDLANIRNAPDVILWDSVLLCGQDHEWRDVHIDAMRDVALLQYTGGTTGVPKGAMLTHANIVINAQQARSWFPSLKEGQQKMVGVLPFFHVFAMTAVMNFSVLAGLEILTLPRFNLIECLKLIHKEKPHLLMAVPAIYNGIINAPQTRKYDLSSLLYGISGGAPLPVQVKADFEALTGCTVVEGYGLTESSPIVCVNPLQGDNIAGSIGLPFPRTYIDIIDPKSGALMPQGERGELCISGPQVMAGYWNNTDATADVLRDGRLHTGDVAIMDERGYVFIVDRLKDMIITNGYNVYPRNIEEAIYKHPAVEECIVAGLPDRQRGEIVKAWIKCRDGYALSAEELKDFLCDQISPMEMPKCIEFRSKSLPKTMIGKLSRKDILAQEGQA